jgi:hypothetical protein
MDILCFGCASLHEAGDNDTALACPACAFSIKRAVYDRLVRHGLEAALFGYHYRLVYASDFEAHGRITLRLTLPDPGPVLVLAALAEASTSLGCKDEAVVARAVARLTAELRDKRSLSVRTLDDPEEYGRFRDAIRDYEAGFKTLPEPVAMAVVEEMIEREYRRLAAKERNPAAIQERRQRELVLKATRNVRKRQPPSASDFNAFWTNLP